MSAEPTSAGSPVRFPQWLVLPTPAAPTSAAQMPDALRDALRAALPREASAHVSVALVPGQCSPQVLRSAEITIHGLSLAAVPDATALLASARGLANAEPVGQAMRFDVEELTAELRDCSMQGFRLSNVQVRASDVVLSVCDTALGGRLAFESAACPTLEAVVTAADIERFVAAQSPWLRDLSVSFGPGSQLSARGRVSLGLFAIPGEAVGVLAVREGTQLVLEQVRVSLSNGRPAPAAVADRLRSANPLVDLGGLARSGLAVELLPPECADGRLVLRGRVLGE